MESRGLDQTEALTSLFWSIRLDQDARWRAEPLDVWKARIVSLVPQAEGWLQQIETGDQILTARYGDVRQWSWHKEGLVLLGDAAHAMSPQLGQGVNLALRDASTLAQCLERYPMSEALARYSAARRLQLTYYSWATRGLTPLFQSDFDGLALPRRWVFRTLQHLPPARWAMTRTMAGWVGR